MEIRPFGDKPVLVKCTICQGVATGVCSYCGGAICSAESCRKPIGGLDPGIACTACYAVIMLKGGIGTNARNN